MIKFNFFGTEIYLSFYFTALITLLVLCDDDYTFLNVLCAVIIHESAHLIALKIKKIKVARCELKLTAVKITTSGINADKSIFVAAFGPLMNFLFFLVFYLFRLYNTANVNLIIGAFNLLPIAGLDGGDILPVLLKSHKNKLGYIVTLLLTILFCTAVILCGVAVFLTDKHNPTLAFVGIYLLFKAFFKL